MKKHKLGLIGKYTHYKGQATPAETPTFIGRMSCRKEDCSITSEVCCSMLQGPLEGVAG